MIDTTRPWTFLPFESERTECWTVYDDNLARIVATFYDRAEMEDYLSWRNKKQAKLKAKHDKKRAVAALDHPGIPQARR